MIDFAPKLWLYVIIWLPQTTDNSTYFAQSLEVRGIESRLYMTSTSSLLSMASVTSSINSNNWVVHDLPALNPCCCFAKRLFDSMWSTILFLIILSMSLHTTEVKLIGL